MREDLDEPVQVVQSAALGGPALSQVARLRRELVRDHDGRRRLHHDPGLIASDPDILCEELLRALPKKLLALPKLSPRDNHREHDAEVPEGGGAEHTSQHGKGHLCPYALSDSLRMSSGFASGLSGFSLAAAGTNRSPKYDKRK